MLPNLLVAGETTPMCPMSCAATKDVSPTSNTNTLENSLVQNSPPENRIFSRAKAYPRNAFGGESNFSLSASVVLHELRILLVGQRVVQRLDEQVRVMNLPAYFLSQAARIFSFFICSGVFPG